MDNLTARMCVHLGSDFVIFPVEVLSSTGNSYTIQHGHNELTFVWNDGEYQLLTEGGYTETTNLITLHVGNGVSKRVFV